MKHIAPDNMFFCFVVFQSKIIDIFFSMKIYVVGTR